VDPVRLGIVGCGGISERHARAAAASDEVSFVACCDTRIDVAEQWAAANGCEWFYGDYPAMVRDHELDGVLIATWPTQHHAQILGCLERRPATKLSRSFGPRRRRPPSSSRRSCIAITRP
jgi:predicted dehydrogenase